jgi:hypothetical protein
MSTEYADEIMPCGCDAGSCYCDDETRRAAARDNAIAEAENAYADAVQQADARRRAAHDDAWVAYRHATRDPP